MMNQQSFSQSAKFYQRRSFTMAACAAPFFLAAPALAQSDEKKKKLPPPEDVTLETKDNVALKATYFPGVHGKKTVPIIIVHGWEGRREQFLPLAASLQRLAGHAVIVPDLRGHGGSVVVKMPGPEKDLTLSPDKVDTTEQMANMVQIDMQRIKKFLFEKNNAGELNIELLTVVGSEFGSIVALNWAMMDWSWPQLPQKEQGRDVKALVLLSPVRRFKRFNDAPALRHPLLIKEPSVMIIAGRDDRSYYNDAKAIYNTFKRHHPIPRTPEEQRLHQDLFWIPLPTSLQGHRLANSEAMGIDTKIATFIGYRLLRRLDEEALAWQRR